LTNKTKLKTPFWGMRLLVVALRGIPPHRAAARLVVRGCEKLLPAVSRSLGFSFLC